MHARYRMSGTFGGDFNLAVWQIFSSNCQSKITANTVVLSEILINSY